STEPRTWRAKALRGDSGDTICRAGGGVRVGVADACLSSVTVLSGASRAEACLCCAPGAVGGLATGAVTGVFACDGGVFGGVPVSSPKLSKARLIFVLCA